MKEKGALALKYLFYYYYLLVIFKILSKVNIYEGKSLPICSTRDSEAMEMSYHLASFFTSFSCLFSFLSSSALKEELKKKAGNGSRMRVERPLFQLENKRRLNLARKLLDCELLEASSRPHGQSCGD